MLAGMKRLVRTERDQYVSMLDAILPVNLANNGVLEEGRVVRSQMRAGGGVNPFLFLEAVVDNIFLRARNGRGLKEVNGFNIEFRMGEESG
jgi:hypothetical protein